MRVALFVLALCGVSMASLRTPTRIVGGTAASPGQFPYMAKTEYQWFGDLYIDWCGGSLLTSTTILSAAHCYGFGIVSAWRVRIGTVLLTGGQDRPVSRFIEHPDYNPFTEDADIAIIRLATPATLSGTVGTARIAGPNYIVPDGSVVTAVGFGALWSGGPTPDVLQYVDLNIINQELCVERYEYLKTLPGTENFPLSVTDTMICAGILDVGGKDACQGDSGGPLAHNGDVIVGVTSWGYRCAEPLYPGVFARVSYFTDWIVENGS